MAVGTSPDTAQIKRFCDDDNTLFVKETDSSFTPLTTGDGTIWTEIGTMKGTTVENNLDEFSDQGDGGKDTVFEETVQNYTVNTTAMQRDKATHELHVNTADKYYQLAVKGKTIGTQTEVHVLCGKFSKKFGPYAIGGDAYLPLSFRTLNNTASIDVDIPTAIATATVTIPQNQMWARDDVA